MSEHDDPEVLADIQLRDRTERERKRREATSYSPPRIVAQWPCRGACGAMVDIGAEVDEMRQTFDRILASRDEKPLEPAKLVFCATCRAKGHAMQADRSRKHVEAMAGAVKQFKASYGRDAALEREHTKRLEQLGHPDIAGLGKSLADKRNGKKTPRGEA